MNESPKHVVISGGTGFIGSALVEQLLVRGHKLTVISRDSRKVEQEFGKKVGACTLDDLPESFDAAVNLAGATLDHHWSEDYKKKIIDSRVKTTTKLREACEQRGAIALISGSAIGYYGERGTEVCTEDTPSGHDFLAKVCIEWEAAAQSDKLRVVCVRTGLVMHRSGGALKAMIPIFKWCLGGRLGNGRGYWSWVHLDDIVGIFAFALENGVNGPLNGCAPNPATNREFTRELAAALGRPVSFPVPAIALRLLYGEKADMLLHRQKVLPKRTLEAGYTFRYPELPGALKAALND
jgi:uncharacterized protein (TIGR01777 family)